jgi:hypothetical protein
MHHDRPLGYPELFSRTVDAWLSGAVLPPEIALLVSRLAPHRQPVWLVADFDCVQQHSVGHARKGMVRQPTRDKPGKLQKSRQ